MSSQYKAQPIVPSQNVSPSHPNNNHVEHVLMEFVKSLTDQVNLGRLPAPEPNVFIGDPLKYPGWKIDFTMLIEQRKVPPSERIHYLKNILAVQPGML